MAEIILKSAWGDKVLYSLGGQKLAKVSALWAEALSLKQEKIPRKERR